MILEKPAASDAEARRGPGKVSYAQGIFPGRYVGAWNYVVTESTRSFVLRLLGHI